MEPCASIFSCLGDSQVAAHLPAAGKTFATREHRRRIEHAICGGRHDAAQLAAQTSPSEWSIEGVSATQHDRAHAKEVVELF